jgi:hypothetical protein
MSTLNSKWYDGLRGDLTKEVKLAVRKACSQGKKGWGVVAVKGQDSQRKSVVVPMFPMFAREDEKDGRPLAYHASVAEEIVIRHELGMSLWSDDMADEETFEGTELSRSEGEMIGKLLTIAQETTLESLRK